MGLDNKKDKETAKSKIGAYKTLNAEKKKDAEEKSEQVVSWHSKYIWDSLKNKITNDDDAIKLSRLMVTNLQNVLQIFSEVYSKKYTLENVSESDLIDSEDYSSDSSDSDSSLTESDSDSSLTESDESVEIKTRRTVNKR